MSSALPTPVFGTPSLAAGNMAGFDRIGDYELLEMIGSGGMGRVFKAHQVSLGRIVAIKILPPALARNQTFTLRFLREARASGKLTHPNVVQGIDCGQDEASGLWYFAMEYVDGHSLADELKRVRALPEDRVIEVGIAIASALEAAARHGIVHRDIKPENILVSRAGEIKLADLGVAKLSHEEDASLTRAEDMVGTPYYVPPEQARGKKDQIDTRSDIYALGATLFHLVTGQPPYDGESCTDIMMKHIQEKVPLAHRVDPAIGEAFSRVLAKMMQKTPAQRYQNPTELRNALERAKLGIFVGRGETTCVDPLPQRTTTARRMAPRTSSSSIRVEPLAGRSRSYLVWGTLALLFSFALLVWFLLPGETEEGPTRARERTPPALPPPLAPPPLPARPVIPANATPPAQPAPPVLPEPEGGRERMPGVASTPAPVPGPLFGNPVPHLEGWLQGDIGEVALPGSVEMDDGALRLKASGADIYARTDEGFFVYRCLRGDSSLTVRVQSIERVDLWSKVGVMFRESLAANARNVFMFAAANNARVLTYRATQGAHTFSCPHGPYVPLPCWLRLTRTGDSFAGFYSKDGEKWTQLGSVTLAMGKDLYACLAASSHLDGTIAAMVVDHFRFEGTPTPPGDWPAPPAAPAPVR